MIRFIGNNDGQNHRKTSGSLVERSSAALREIFPVTDESAGQCLQKKIPNDFLEPTGDLIKKILGGFLRAAAAQ